MVTKARKKFVVVAYDISSARRRNKVVKILQQYGRRINFRYSSACSATASCLQSERR